MNEAVAQAPPSQFNLAAHLLARNASRATRIAYADDRKRLSYGELDERVRRFARVLQEHGMRPEERVLLLAHVGREQARDVARQFAASLAGHGLVVRLVADEARSIRREDRTSRDQQYSNSAIIIDGS